MSRPDIIAANRLRGSSMLRSSDNGVAQGLRAFVRAAQRDLRHRVAQHAGSDRVALGVVGVQQAFRRRPLDHLGQLPSQVHRILHADVEALSAHPGNARARRRRPAAPVPRGRPRPAGSCR